MKRSIVLVCCFVFVSALAGCQDSVNQPSENGHIVDANKPAGKFPEFLVGVWEAEVSEFSKWAFKFEPDGSMRRIIHVTAGHVKLEEGGVYGNSPEGDAYYYFAMGPCEADYTPETRTLKVKIIVDHFTMKLPQGVLEGRVEDYFDGPVSEDGKFWRADWRSYGWLEGGSPPDPNLIEANPQKLVFSKLDLEKLQEAGQQPQ